MCFDARMVTAPDWDTRWDLGPAFIPKERYTTRAFAEVERG